MNEQDFDAVIKSGKHDLDTIRAVNTMIKRVVTSIMFMSVFVLSASVITFGYWYIEPDPLDVRYINGESTWSLCHDRKYTFKRLVASEKDLKISVQGFWRDLDGMMDYEGYRGQFVDTDFAIYTLKAGTMQAMTFNKDVPKTKEIQTGRYEYTPVATYTINPIKTITRPLPSQFVNVECDYDPIKHKGGN